MIKYFTEIKITLKKENRKETKAIVFHRCYWVYFFMSQKDSDFLKLRKPSNIYANLV